MIAGAAIVESEDVAGLSLKTIAKLAQRQMRAHVIRE